MDTVSEMEWATVDGNIGVRIQTPAPSLLDFNIDASVNALPLVAEGTYIIIGNTQSASANLSARMFGSPNSIESAEVMSLHRANVNTQLKAGNQTAAAAVNDNTIWTASGYKVIVGTYAGDAVVTGELSVVEVNGTEILNVAGTIGGQEASLRLNLLSAMDGLNQSETFHLQGIVVLNKYLDAAARTALAADPWGWVSGSIGDSTPDAFPFTSQTDVAVSTTITSAAVTITGINTGSPITVGAGATYDINASGNFVSTPGTVYVNDTVRVRHVSSSLNSTSVVSSVTIGGVTETFTSTTVAPPADTVPDAFPFTAQTDVALSTLIVSAAVTISGITAASQISVANGEYDINGSGVFTATAGTVNNGDTVRARHTSSAAFSTGVTTTVTIGGISEAFTSTTTNGLTTYPNLTITATNAAGNTSSASFSMVVSDVAPSGGAALFFTSAESLPPNSYLTIYGFNLSAVTDVKIGGKSQTVVNASYDYNHLPLHPAMMKLGKDTGIYTVNLTVDANGEPTNTEKYQKIDVLLDNVVAGDTGLQLVGAGLVTNTDGTFTLTDTMTSFAVHAGNVRFVSQTGSDSAAGTEAAPWLTPEYALDNTSPGDAIYIRAGVGQWSTSMNGTFGDPVALYFTSARGGSSGLPKLVSAYPGETVQWAGSSISDFVEFPGSSVTVTDVCVHGFELISDGLGAKGFVSWRGPSTKNRIRFSGNYGFGLYAGASGCFIEVSGAGTSYTNGTDDIQVIGNYCDLTSQVDLGNSNAHVYYHGGRSYSQNTYFNHNRNTRHGIGRVVQLYGHQGGFPTENVKGFYNCFNNYEGSKQATQKPSVLRIAGFDPPPGSANWYEDINLLWNTFSGGADGIHIQGGPVCTQGTSISSIIGHDNVGYNNDIDINLVCYGTADFRRNMTEGAIVFSLEAPNGTTTVDVDNVTTYPTGLA
ncbi:MAG TPA: hypothetical protein ENK38_01300 [Gammaproteobacteria bacterium]|nr:hypothetical protein [Gammaproteobacteria bacterium]